MTDLQKNKKQRVLLMGCGGVGGVIAAGLLRAGYDLTIVTRNSEITHAVNTYGLRVTTPGGKWSIPVTAYTNVNELKGQFDTALLAMKAIDAEQAARDVSEYLREEGYVVTLQNGLVVDAVAAILSRWRVIGALVGWGATLHKPGVYEMTSAGEIVIGELNSQVTSRAQQLKTMLDTATPTTISTNIYGALWSKLAINCVITTLGAVTGQLLGQILRHPATRRLALSIASEVVDVAEARGILLQPVGGTLDIHRLYLYCNRRARGFGFDLLLKHAIMLTVGLKFRRLKSSMLQSIERRRPTEIDFLNGYVAKCGMEKGIMTPVNAALTKMVHEIEAGERTPSTNNLKGLLQGYWPP